MKIIARNKKAGFDYQIISKYIGGLALKGWQVKSIKAGNVSVKQTYAYIRKGECYLKGMQISDWPGMNEFERQQIGEDIKVLLHKSELKKIVGQLQVKGLALLPLALGLERGLIKVELGLGKGLKKYDKRKRKQERDLKQQTQKISVSKYF